jgi:hypothetical protein
MRVIEHDVTALPPKELRDEIDSPVVEEAAA